MTLAGIFTISLNGLRFFAEHGMYPEEMKVGHEFELNLSLEISEPENDTLQIEDTVDYSELFLLVQEIFKRRRFLLEHLATEIAEAARKRFPATKKVHVAITKISPPITNFSGTVSVQYSKSYD